jgi:hypothetical protein
VLAYKACDFIPPPSSLTVAGGALPIAGASTSADGSDEYQFVTAGDMITVLSSKDVVIKSYTPQAPSLATSHSGHGNHYATASSSSIVEDN